MEDLLAKGLELLTQGGVVVGALLAILGGLKVLARYTSSEADDKVLEKVENALIYVRDLLGKVKK